jgi:hypothetical protein
VFCHLPGLFSGRGSRGLLGNRTLLPDAIEQHRGCLIVASFPPRQLCLGRHQLAGEGFGARMDWSARARVALIRLSIVSSKRISESTLVGHLEKEQIGDLLDVVAVVDAIVAEGVAEAAEFLDDIGHEFVSNSSRGSCDCRMMD